VGEKVFDKQTELKQTKSSLCVYRPTHAHQP